MGKIRAVLNYHFDLEVLSKRRELLLIEKKISKTKSLLQRLERGKPELAICALSQLLITSRKGEQIVVPKAPQDRSEQQQLNRLTEEEGEVEEESDSTSYSVKAELGRTGRPRTLSFQCVQVQAHVLMLLF